MRSLRTSDPYRFEVVEYEYTQKRQKHFVSILTALPASPDPDDTCHTIPAAISGNFPALSMQSLSFSSGFRSGPKTQSFHATKPKNLSTEPPPPLFRASLSHPSLALSEGKQPQKNLSLQQKPQTHYDPPSQPHTNYEPQSQSQSLSPHQSQPKSHQIQLRPPPYSLPENDKTEVQKLDQNVNQKVDRKGALEGDQNGVTKGDQKGDEKGVVKGGKRRIGIKIEHAGLKRLLSGAIAGAVSRTAVAPLETIRTHLMVGAAGKTVGEVWGRIVEEEGWRGLFRGNGVNVLRVAPSKAIELYAYDSMKRVLTDPLTLQPRIPFPLAPIAGATAGVFSTLITYPLELLKTRLTIQRGVYKNLSHAFLKICEEEGPRELYRGLSSSLIGVIPYAATNYFAYDSLRKIYRKISHEEHIGNIATLIIGSLAGAISSTATFPLEVARKQLQVGAISGRVVYRDVGHALTSIMEKEGIKGLYRGLGASCIKLMPAAGISFMCYEACKRVLINEES